MWPCMLVLDFYKLCVDLITLTEVCLRCVCVCGALFLMPHVVLRHICSVVNQLQACGTEKKTNQWLKIFIM